MDLSDVLDDAEQLRIVNTLGRLTVSDKIAWQAVGKDVSLTTLGSHRYELSSQDDDGEPPYSLTIFRKRKGRPESNWPQSNRNHSYASIL